MSLHKQRPLMEYKVWHKRLHDVELIIKLQPRFEHPNYHKPIAEDLLKAANIFLKEHLDKLLELKQKNFTFQVRMTSPGIAIYPFSVKFDTFKLNLGYYEFI